MFIQSHVPQHAELSWVLGCYTQFGELSRMTQFKDKSAKARRQYHGGPVYLPRSDGGGYSALPGGPCPGGGGPEAACGALPGHRPAIQRRLFGDTFKLPEPFIPKMGARIMSLGNPTSKMSKSDPDGCVYLMDKPEDIMRKFKRAVTDCEAERAAYDKENKPGISNLLTIYCAATGKTMAEAEARICGPGLWRFQARRRRGRG